MVCLIKLIPVLNIATWIYVWIVLIALIKVMNVVFGYVVRKQFVAVHSVMNKATGALLFLRPLTLSVIELKYSSVVVCLFATIAAVQEGYYIRIGKMRKDED